VPVTSDLPQVRDVVGGCGATFELGVVEAIQRHLRTAIEVHDSERRSRGRERVVGRHDWSETVTNTTAQLADHCR
jgi:hypothetical protein